MLCCQAMSRSADVAGVTPPPMNPQSYSMNVAINVQRGSNGVFEANTIICRCQVRRKL